MSPKPLIAIMVLAALPLVGMAPARAQGRVDVQAPIGSVAPHRPRIEVTPRPLVYRRCVDWYELQYRPSGTVLFPQRRCWWVRG